MGDTPLSTKLTFAFLTNTALDEGPAAKTVNEYLSSMLNNYDANSLTLLLVDDPATIAIVLARFDQDFYTKQSVHFTSSETQVSDGIRRTTTEELSATRTTNTSYTTEPTHSSGDIEYTTETLDSAESTELTTHEPGETSQRSTAGMSSTMDSTQSGEEIEYTTEAPDSEKSTELATQEFSQTTERSTVGMSSTSDSTQSGEEIEYTTETPHSLESAELTTQEFSETTERSTAGTSSTSDSTQSGEEIEYTTEKPHSLESTELTTQEFSETTERLTESTDTTMDSDFTSKTTGTNEVENTWYSEERDSTTNEIQETAQVELLSRCYKPVRLNLHHVMYTDIANKSKHFCDS